MRWCDETRNALTHILHDSGAVGLRAYMDDAHEDSLALNQGGFMVIGKGYGTFKHQCFWGSLALHTQQEDDIVSRCS